MSSSSEVQPASPLATGGGGTEFENKVDAAFLALLLVNGPVPFLGTAALEEMHLQAGHLGWRTDDLLLVARSPGGVHRRAALQVKQTFSISRSDRECTETFRRAWNDFHDADLFNPSEDRLGIITPAPSQRFLRGFRALLEASRASTDGADFTNRLSLAKYLPAEAKEFAAVIREICQNEHADEVPDDAFLAFLKRLDFACLDLDGDSPTVALLRGLLSTHASSGAHSDDVWPALVRYAAESAPRAQSILRHDLPDQLRRLLPGCSSAASASTQALRQLSRTADLVVSTTGRTIVDYHVGRPAVVQLILDAIEEHDIVLLVGSAGAGKSALAAEVFESLRRDRLAIALRAVQLATSHISETMSHQGLALPELDQLFAMHPRKIALLESVERLLETGFEHRSAFSDFLTLTSGASGWKLIITCRDYHAEVVRNMLLPDVTHGVVRIPVFSDEDLVAVAAAVPQLSMPLASQPLRELLRNPFILDKAARLNWAHAEFPDTLQQFRRKFWREIARREDEQADGLPARRASALVAVAVSRAKSMLPFVRCHDIADKAALSALARDGLLLRDPDVDDSFTAAHDVIEDWAVLEWLEREFDTANMDWRSLIGRVGTSPAIRRAVRLWASERVPLESRDGEFLTLATDGSIEQHWRHDLLAGVLISDHAGTFLHRNRSLLVADGCALLQLALHVVRVGCRRLPDNVVPRSEIAPLTLIPDGSAWGVLAEFLADPATAAALPRPLATLLMFIQDWSAGIISGNPYPYGSSHVASIAGRLLLYSQRLGPERRDAVRAILLSTVFALPNDGRELVETLTKNTITTSDSQLADQVRATVLSHFTGEAMARDRPDLVFQLLEWDWGARGGSEEADETWTDHRFDVVERAFGFPSRSNDHHFPASSFQGPWANLFVYHPDRTLELIIRLANRACGVYAAHPRGLEPAEKLTFQDLRGTHLVLWGNDRIYKMFRGTSVGPYALLLTTSPDRGRGQVDVHAG